MSQKYHVNAMGDARPCHATQGGCPFGDESEHFNTKDEARAAYENAMEENITNYMKKNGADLERIKQKAREEKWEAEEKARNKESIDGFYGALESGEKMKSALDEHGQFNGGSVSSNLSNIREKLYGKQYTSEEGRQFIREQLTDGTRKTPEELNTIDKIAYPIYNDRMGAPLFPFSKKVQEANVRANLDMLKARGLKETGEILDTIKNSELTNKQSTLIVRDRSLDTLSPDEIREKFNITPYENPLV